MFGRRFRNLFAPEPKSLMCRLLRDKHDFSLIEGSKTAVRYLPIAAPERFEVVI